MQLLITFAKVNANAKTTVAKDTRLTEKGVEQSSGSDIISIEQREKYLEKPIVENDNKSIREWYYTNVNNIPNLIDKSLPIEEQAKQAFELRNKYKREARKAMSDKETAELLEKSAQFRVLRI